MVRARRTAAARGLSSSRGEETGPRLCVDYLGQTLQVRESSPHEFTSSAGGNVGSPHKGHQGTLTPRFLPQNCCQVQVVGHHSRARARFSLSTEDGAATLLLSFSFSLFSRTPRNSSGAGQKPRVSHRNRPPARPLAPLCPRGPPAAHGRMSSGTALPSDGLRCLFAGTIAPAEALPTCVTVNSRRAIVAHA